MNNRTIPTKHKQPQLVKTKVPSAIKQRNSSYFAHHKLSYRLPVILTFFSLMLLILAIPSIIVLSFGNKMTDTVETEEHTNQYPEEEEAISVAVMRTKADVIEDVPLESYIVGVVAAEMPVDFEIEALKAQALAARTYAVSHLLGDDDVNEYDLTDTIQHQVYKNNQELQQLWGSAYEENIAKIREAVDATAGEIITYDDKPIMPAFFSMSNGYTENSEDYWENELAYLRSVESTWELEQPNLINQETFSAESLGELLELDLTENATPDIAISRKPSGRVEQLTVDGNTFTGREVREKLELRSSDFSVKQNNAHYIFTTKGNGHGVGMSQYGADGMAKEGRNYQEIVKHYYKDVEISNIGEAAPALVSR